MVLFLHVNGYVNVSVGAVPPLSIYRTHISVVERFSVGDWVRVMNQGPLAGRQGQVEELGNAGMLTVRSVGAHQAVGL